MTVVLKIHLEAAGPLPDDGFVWWAESDDLPGFNAAADHLPQLLSQSTEAIKEITGVDDIAILPQMVFDGETSQKSGEPVNDSAPAAPVREVFLSTRMFEPA